MHCKCEVKAVVNKLEDGLYHVLNDIPTDIRDGMIKPDDIPYMRQFYDRVADMLEELSGEHKHLPDHMHGRMCADIKYNPDQR